MTFGSVMLHVSVLTSHILESVNHFTTSDAGRVVRFAIRQNKERSLMGRPARGLMLAADNHRSEERAAKLTIGSAAVTR